ncbi:uncharacterized protein LOC109710994 isoform X2 [Ananas comosus]|uniref:Uncharacterized protein LOC109710994 isoform X2 n=1 Tax=Ananas comosus TaxID=4615 RepID=A0A6P5EZX8_ANACO|nr:uncharacterized protein LOC109710994 isoform X2 [Ananas comosus]
MKPDDKRRVQPSGGGGGGKGYVCHACGWACTNPHPSAKQRRSHRKHCGKSAAAAAAEGRRRVSDEELSDEDRRKKDDVLVEGESEDNGGGEKEFDRNGSDGETGFGGLGGDCGDLEKVRDNNLDSLLQLHSLVNDDCNTKCSEIQLTTREHLAGHVVLNNLQMDGTETTTFDDDCGEEEEVFNKQGRQHVTMNAELNESAENADNKDTVRIPTASVLSGDATNISSFIYSEVDNVDKRVEISVPMNHANGVETMRNDFPTEIDPHTNGVILSTSSGEQTWAEMPHNESLCRSSSEINAREHVDDSVSGNEGKNLNDLSIASNAPSKDNSQVVGSFQDKNFPIESDEIFDSVGAKARDVLESHVEGEVPEMVSSVFSLRKSDEFTGEDPLNEKVHEVNSLHDQSSDAAAIDYSTNRHIKNNTSPTVTEVDIESASSLGNSGGCEGLGSLGLNYNQVNSCSTVGDSSGFQETASDTEFLDSLEHETEYPFKQTETHELVFGSFVVSDADCDALSAVSHFSETFITDDERPDLMQEENGLKLHVDGDDNALEEADSQQDSSLKCLEISHQKSEYLSYSPSDQLNYQNLLEETNAEAEANDESNNLGLLEECCEEGESESGHLENVSGHELSLVNEHKDGLAGTIVDNHNDHSFIELFLEISGVKEVPNGKTVSDDTESTINKSVANHESNGNGIFEVISSSDCHQNLLEDLHVESEEEPDIEIVMKTCFSDSSFQSDTFEEKQGSNPDGGAPEIEHKTNELPTLHAQTPVCESADATKVLSSSDTAINDSLGKNRSHSRDFIVTSPPPANADHPTLQMGQEIQVEKRAQQEIQARKNEEIATKVVRWNSQKAYVPLRALLAEANFESDRESTKADNNKMPTTTAFAKSRSLKDEASLATSASSRSAADRKEWSSPARLPKGMDKKRRAKGKQGWAPFMCCPSTN